MIPAQTEHAVAGQHVQVLNPLDVPEVRSFGAGITAVKTNGLERADIRGVYMLVVQFVIAALVLPQQGPDIQAGSRRFLHFSI
jgi:hypothetical protein